MENETSLWSLKLKRSGKWNIFISPQMSQWAQSKYTPGQFLGTTEVRVLTTKELAAGSQAWARKNQLIDSKPVTSGMGMHLLKKMGWTPGEGLGKESNGSLMPLLLELKLDKRGLESNEEVSKVDESLKEISANSPRFSVKRIKIKTAAVQRRAGKVAATTTDLFLSPVSNRNIRCPCWANSHRNANGARRITHSSTNKGRHMPRISYSRWEILRFTIEIFLFTTSNRSDWMASITLAQRRRTTRRRQSPELPSFACSSWAFCHLKVPSPATLLAAPTWNLLSTPFVVNAILSRWS